MRDRLQSRKCARFLKVLADPSRLKLVQALQSGPRNVSELAQLLGQNLAIISHHLRVLARGGVVETEREGKFVNYRLRADVFRYDAGNQASVLDFGCCRLELTPTRETSRLKTPAARG